jgi:hypothetical protein
MIRENLLLVEREGTAFSRADRLHLHAHGTTESRALPIADQATAIQADMTHRQVLSTNASTLRKG